MNIFVLDKNPIIAAKYHCDKHVVKMPLETAQMLCTVLQQNGIPAPYRPTHKSHPCTRWTAESGSNFDWLIALGLALCQEYTFRYNKIHACQKVIEYCRDNKPNFNTIELTPHALAMPIECKISKNPVKCYREYYKVHKTHLHVWKSRNKPKFIC